MISMTDNKRNQLIRITKARLSCSLGNDALPWEMMPRLSCSLGNDALPALITFYASLSGFCLGKTTLGWFKTISHRMNVRILSCLNVFQTCCVTMPGLKVIYFFYR